MGTSWETCQRVISDALNVALIRARTPPERVARHWEQSTQLTWFGASADHSLIHVSWSFGRLRGNDEPGLHTVGVFQLSKAIFSEVDENKLRAALEALIPAGTDGATKVFLMRVAAQIVVGEWLLRHTPAPALSMFLKPDGINVPAPTPRWPEHARERVTAALKSMEPALSKRIETVFSSPHEALLESLRSPQ
ncbi:MAG: hypothetical protein ACO1OB_21455 [Archangium sp.]